MMEKWVSLTTVAICSVLFVLTPVARGEDKNITCLHVYGYMKPCMTYLTGGDKPPPPAACCTGFKGLSAAITTVANKQIACTCLKASWSTIKVDYDRSKALTQDCKVKFDLPADPNVDCTKVKLVDA